MVRGIAMTPNLKTTTKRHSVSYICIAGLLIIYALICIMPFWYVMVSSISDPMLIKEGQFRLLPNGFSLKAYEMVFRDQKFFNGLKITVLRTVVGTAIALVLQTMTAYVLSKSNLRGRKLFTFMVVFTILFNGGIIPTYLVVQNLGLLDSFWALVLPIAFSPWNVMLLINSFAALPVSIEESAKLDGANDFVVFYKFAVPLSMPSIATILLFIAVRHWNELMDGVIYINKSTLKPLQVYLIELVMQAQTQGMMEPSEQFMPSVSIQTAVIFASCVPIIMIYPLLQRYFVKGIMVGAVKG